MNRFHYDNVPKTYGKCHIDFGTGFETKTGLKTADFTAFSALLFLSQKRWVAGIA